GQAAACGVALAHGCADVRLSWAPPRKRSVAWTAREIAAASVFFRSLAIIAPTRAPQSPSVVRLRRIALAFDGQSRSKQRREGNLLPCRDAASVQLKCREPDRRFCSAIFDYA